VSALDSPSTTDVIDRPFAGRLPPAPITAASLAYGASGIDQVRRLVEEAATAAGLTSGRRDDLVVAVSEIASNSVRHGGGSGVLRIWSDERALVCQVEDAGYIRDPLAGRVRPAPTAEGGRGLWLANHLCDLVEIRSSERGTVVRMRMELPGR